MHACTHACIHAFIINYRHTCIPTYTRAYTHVFIYEVYLQIYMHICSHVYICKYYTCIYMHIYIYNNALFQKVRTWPPPSRPQGRPSDTELLLGSRHLRTNIPQGPSRPEQGWVLMGPNGLVVPYLGSKSLHHLARFKTPAPTWTPQKIGETLVRKPQKDPKTVIVLHTCGVQVSTLWASAWLFGRGDPGPQRC